MNIFNIKFKNDYLKYGSRKRLNTLIREDLLNNFEEISKITGQPKSKMLDVLLLEMMQTEETVDSFLNKVRKY